MTDAAGSGEPAFVLYASFAATECRLPAADERRALLADHGRMGRDYPQVRANTVAAFALGDYEWLLAFEADEFEPLVDLMCHLRGAQARRHTRHELPFLTGIRKPLAEIVADLV